MSTVSYATRGTLTQKSINVKYRILGFLLLILLFFVPRYGKGFPPFTFVLVLSLPYLFLQYKRRYEYKLNYFNLIYAVVYISALLIHFYSGSVYSIVLFISYFALTHMIVAQSVRTKKDFDQSLSIILAVLTIYSVFVLIESITGVNAFDIVFARPSTWVGHGVKRYGLYLSTGFMSVMHNNATLMCMAWALAAYRLCNCGNHKIRWFVVWAIIGLSCMTIMSRTILFTAPFLQLIIFHKQGTKWLSQRAVVLVVIGTFLFVFIGSEMLAPLLNAVVGLVAPIVDEIFGTTLKTQVGSTLGGSGHRSILWVWILDAVKGSLLFGKGFTEEWTTTVYGQNLIGQVWSSQKTSIEVYWLRTLYNTGLFGLIGFIVYQVGVFLKTWRQRVNCYEKKVTFQYTVKWIAVFYFFHLFGLAASEDLQFFYLLFALYLSYIHICNHNQPNRIRKAGVRYARRSLR